MQIDLLCPVENQGVTVKTNSKTGEPYALLKLFNLSRRMIDSVSFIVRVYDANGGALGEIQVDLKELEGQPQSFFAENKAVSLAEYPEAKHITAEFLEVTFAEGEPYVKEGEPTEITIPEPDYDEKMRLISAAGEDAQCYAHDLGPHWICVCGRPNLNGADNCVRCGREKAYVMAHFSSRDALNQTLVEQMEAEKRAEEEKKAAEAQAKAERSRKRRKTALRVVVGVAALAVLCVLGYLAYDGIMILSGNSAAKKGDYLAAYSRYAAAGSVKKLATVSEEVRGNSNANLTQSGILASDDENLYYIDSSYAIYKESKATGEKTRLGDAEGIYLNVLNGWVYYLDANTGQALCRISTSGDNTEVLYEVTEGHFGSVALVGNELYFVLQEPAKNVTPEMQEQAAQQGGNTYQYRLYRLKVGAKKPKLVSDLNISQFVTYQGSIYYFDEEGSLCSMNRKGADVKKLVSGPVYGFDVYADNLYYLDGSQTEDNGQPKLTLEKADLDGTYSENIVADQLVIGFNFDEGALYYLAYVNGMAELHKKSGGEDTVILETCQLFNMADGYMMYVTPMGEFMKTKFDKSGFEEIKAAAPEAQDSGTNDEPTPKASPEAETEAPAAESAERAE